MATVSSEYLTQTGVQPGVQFVLSKHTHPDHQDGVVPSMMLLPAATTVASFDAATSATVSTVQGGVGGKCQLVIVGAAGDVGDYSATVGDHARALHVSFADTYTTGYYHCTGVAVSGSDLLVTINLDFTSSTTGTVSRLQAGALSSEQGTISTLASPVRSGNLLVDFIDSADASAGVKVYLYLEGSASAENEYKLYLMSIGGAVVTPVQVGNTFSIRTNVVLTAAKFLQSEGVSDTPATSLSSGDTMYFYPEAHTPDSNGYYVAEFVQTGGSSGTSTAHLIQSDVDGVADMFALVDFGGGSLGDDTFRLYLKAAAVAGTDYVRAGTSVDLFITSYDSEMRASNAFTITVVLGVDPTSSGNVTLAENTANREGVDATNGHSAYIWTEDLFDVPVASLTFTAHAGSATSVAADDTTNFRANSTFAVVYSDGGGGTTDATLTSPSDVHAVGAARYLDGLKLELSGIGGTYTATASSDTVLNFPVAVGGNAGAGTLTLRDVSGAEDVAYVALKASPASGAASAPTYTAPAFTVTENGYTFAYTPTLLVRFFKQMVAADFTAVMVEDTGNPRGTVTGDGAGRLECADASTKQLSISWDTSLGIDFVYPSIAGQDVTLVEAVEVDSAGNETDISGNAEADAPILAYDNASPATTAASAGVATIDLIDDVTDTPAAFFVADDMETRFMEMSFSFLMKNVLDDGGSAVELFSGSVSASATDLNGSITNMRVYQDMEERSSQQSRFYLNIRDGGYTDGLELRNNTFKGGRFFDIAADTNLVLGTATTGIQIDDVTDSIELDTSSTPVRPFESLSVNDATVDDNYATTASSVTLSSLDVYHYAPVVPAFTSNTSTQSVPVDGGLVDTTQWISFPFSHINSSVSGGIGLLTDNAAEMRQALSGAIVVASSTQLQVTLTDHNSGTSSDDPMTTEGAVVKISGSATLDGSYTVAAGSTDTLLLLTGSGLTDAGAESGVLRLIDADLGRGVPTVKIGTSSGGNEAAALFEYVLVDSGGATTGNDNGAACAVKIRLVDTDETTYNGQTYYVSVEYPAYSVSTVADGAVGDGQTGSEELWAAASDEVALTLSNITWSLNSFSDAIYTNFQPAEDPLDPDGTVYEDSAHLTQLRLLNAGTNGANFTVSNLGGLDKFALLILKVADLSEATIDACLNGTTNSWGGTTHLTYSNITTGSAAVTAALAHGATFLIDGVVATNQSYLVGDTAADLGHADRAIVNGTSDISVVIDPDVVADGTKFIIVMVTAEGLTADGTSLGNSFISRCEVRYSGGIESFVLATRDELTYPGAISLEVSSVLAHNQNGDAILGSPAAIAGSTFDYTISAAIGASGSSIDATDADSDTWRWLVASGSAVSHTALLAAMEGLPDGVWGTYTNAAYDSADKEVYNTANGLSAHSSNTTVYRRIFYRVGLRLHAAGASPDSNTLTTDDDDFAYYAIAGNHGLVDSFSSVVQAWGPYGRDVVTDDDHYKLTVGMVHSSWTDQHTSSQSDINVYAFSRRVQSLDLVEDEDVLVGST